MVGPGERTAGSLAAANGVPAAARRPAELRGGQLSCPAPLQPPPASLLASLQPKTHPKSPGAPRCHQAWGDGSGRDPKGVAEGDSVRDGDTVGLDTHPLGSRPPKMWRRRQSQAGELHAKALLQAGYAEEKATAGTKEREQGSSRRNLTKDGATAGPGLLL